MGVRDQLVRNVSVGDAVLKAERINRSGDVPLLRLAGVPLSCHS